MQIKEKGGTYYVPTEIEEQTFTVNKVKYELMDYSLIKKYFPSIYKDIKKSRKLKD